MMNTNKKVIWKKSKKHKKQNCGIIVNGGIKYGCHGESYPAVQLLNII